MSIDNPQIEIDEDGEVVWRWFVDDRSLDVWDSPEGVWYAITRRAPGIEKDGFVDDWGHLRVLLAWLEGREDIHIIEAIPYPVLVAEVARRLRIEQAASLDLDAFIESLEYASKGGDLSEFIKSLEWRELYPGHLVRPCVYCNGRGCRHCDCRLCGCGLCACCNGNCKCNEEEQTP